MKASVPHFGYTPNQEIPLEIDVHNQSHVDVDIRAEFLKVREIREICQKYMVSLIIHSLLWFTDYYISRSTKTRNSFM